jgi:hypothetical protein
MPRLFIVLVLAVSLLGCSKSTDPISRVVTQESHNEFFGNGMWSPIRLPPSATATQVISSILGTNLTILEVRSVRVSYNDETAKIIDPNYIGVLVKNANGQKVYLLQYQPRSGGWRSWDHDVK